MPLNESALMGEKLRFCHLRLWEDCLLCAGFCISRYAGHKVIERYRDSGLEVLATASESFFDRPTACPFRSSF